ncbi:TIGR02099 family protein [Aliikangiella marina]|uniref:TIGR02099 family protein n=1 Tax=Aliikangiella marina TaxID=1712262 RepID=A0A545TDT9_9GAMM|nr:YhdP family protein [Aliikangiella marina]TQV75385.1 TIGR02099 family protein [Aliikangiella marina]
METKLSNPITRACIFMVNKLWLLFATLVILVALVFTLLRLALPKIDVYKTDIEQWIENQYQVEVDIADISAEWGANGPVLSLNKFEIKSDDGQLDLLEVDSLEIDVDALGSVLAGRLVTENISLIGLRVNVLLDRQLAVRLDTLEDDQQTEAIPDVDETSQVILKNIFSQKKLVVLDSFISVETLTGKSFNYQIAQLDIENFDEVHQFKGQLDDEYGGSIKLVAEMVGDPADDDSYTNLFLQGENLDLTELPIYEKHPELRPASGKFNWRVWSDWREGRWKSAVGDVQVAEIKWSVGEQEKSANLINTEFDKFSLNFSWKYNTPSTGELMFHNATLEANQQKSINFSNVYLLFNQLEAQDIQWEFISHDFEIAPLLDYFALPLIGQTQTDNSLVDANLNINLSSLGARFLRKSGNWSAPEFFTQFDKLSYDNLFDLPKITNLSGDISFSQGIGALNISATDTEIDLNGLFRDRLTFESVALDINWYTDNQGKLDLQINDAFLVNNDLNIAAKSRFFYHDEKPTFSLFAEVKDVDLSTKSTYLPSGVMSENLVKFLDESVKNGRLDLAKSVVRGPLDAFPFENQDGIFSVLGFVKDTEFKFLPDWPQVNKLKARLSFEGNGMDLQALGGQSGLVDVNFARAVIKDFSAPNTPFELTIDANARDNGGYEFLRRSPLSNIAQSISVLDYQGNAQTKLQLTLGLDDSSNLKLSGSVIPEKNKAIVAVGGFKFNELNGELHFDENGIKTSQIESKYFSEPITATLTGGKRTSDAELTIEASGFVGPAAIADLVGEKWSTLAEGKSLIKAKVDIAPTQDSSAVLLEFQSDLEGMRLSLPGSLAKAADDTTPITVNVRLDEISNVTIDWRDFDGRWWWSQENGNYQHIGGRFLLASEQTLPEKSLSQYTAEVNLGGESLEEWLPIIDKIIDQAESSEVATAEQRESYFPETSIAIHVEQLNNELFDIKDLQLDLSKKSNENWLIRASGPIGQIDLTLKDNAPWEAKIAGLDVNFTESFRQKFSNSESSEAHQVVSNVNDDEVINQEANQQQGLAEKPDIITTNNQGVSKIDIVSNWPSINIDCNQCKIQQFDLGTAKLSLVQENGQLDLFGNIAKSKSHTLRFRLGWTQDKLTNEEVNSKNIASWNNLSQIDFELASENIGLLLARLNYESGVKESRGYINGNMSWPDTPWDFDLLEADGKANFTLGKGYLSEVSDAKARLFSLFSLQTLSRRLQLDFSDVYKKGFFYDRIRGQVSLADQVLSSHNIFVEGNAAKVTMIGDINLKDKTIEQNALVLPQLTSSLPVLVGWAVEPTTGILVFLLNKIFEPAIEVVTQIEYRIHGALDNMTVDEVKKSQSKVKYDTPENLPEENNLDQMLEQDAQQDKSFSDETERAKDIENKR